MTIQEAIQSGKRFRRHSWNNGWSHSLSVKDDWNYFRWSEGVSVNFREFTVEDILATDWEVEFPDLEEDKFVITESEIIEMLNDVSDCFSEKRYDSEYKMNWKYFLSNLKNGDYR